MENPKAGGTGTNGRHGTLVLGGFTELVVPGVGATPNLVMVCGEAPGREEAFHQPNPEPFVGKSGREQDRLFMRFSGSGVRRYYRTNTVKTYLEGNPDPTPELTRRWTPVLMRELDRVQPKVIVAVGRFAMKWFLGERASLKVCHGIPHRAGAFDARRRDRGGPQDAIVIPVTHVAAGFYSPEARSVISWDYEQACRVIEEVKKGKLVRVRGDEFAGRETYVDVTGEEFEHLFMEEYNLSGADPEVIGVDTEGSLENRWAIQVSDAFGRAYVLRTEQPDFHLGIEYLQYLANNGTVFAMHQASTPQGCCWDVQVCKRMGLDLITNPDIKIWDTMYAAYLLRLEPQGLKALAHRWCGMDMEDYKRVIGKSGAQRQLDYLAAVIDGQWPAVETRVVTDNAGESKPYTPRHIAKSAEAILIDYGTLLLTRDDEDQVEDDPDKESDEVDFLYKRWRDTDVVQRREVERALGRMPHSSLSDIPLDQAIRYAARDADATLRLYHQLAPALKARGLDKLMAQAMEVLPIFTEMQETGLPVSKYKFIALRDQLQKKMHGLAYKISKNFYGGKPFNPKSTKQVGALLRRRGLQSAKRTATGAMSTGKQGIEHLRYEDPAVDLVMQWREAQHTKDMFAVPAIETLEEAAERNDVDSVTDMRCKLKPSRTTTRRLASFDPNFLAFPKHEKPGGVDYGKQVRSCFVCPPGEVLMETDYSQIEVRVLAHESRDPILCRLFTEIDPTTGKLRDVHTETAARVFGVRTSEITKEDVRRFIAKRVTFGIAYGVSGAGLATQIRMNKTNAQDRDWSVDDCDRLIKEWLKLYKGCAEYFARVEREVMDTGMVRDYSGMIRYLAAVHSDDPKMASEARRQAVNHRIQGGAQQMIQHAMMKLRRPIRELQDEGVGVRWALQVHDALMFRMREEEVEVVKPVVEEVMVTGTGIKLRVPVVVESKVASSWGAL